MDTDDTGTNPAGLSPAKAELLRRRRAGWRPATGDDVTPRAGGPCPLTPAQEAVWVAEQLTPGTAAWTLGHVVELDRPLDGRRLAAALDSVVDRHPVLRTVVRTRDGVPWADPAGPAPVLEIVDLSAEEANAGPAGTDAALEVVRAARETPFDITGGPVARMVQVRLPGRDVLGLLVHHLVGDGWALGVALHELSAFYLGGPGALRPATGPGYAELAHERAARGASHRAEHREWWQRTLAGMRAVELPADRSRPPVGAPEVSRGDWCALDPGPELDREVRRVARERGTTPYAVLLAATAVLVHAMTGDTDVVLGSAVSGRDDPRLAGLIGPFAGVLPVRTGPRRELRFDELLTAVSQASFDALARQDVPLAEIAAGLPVPRDPGPVPVLVVLQPGVLPDVVAGARARTLPLGWRTARADLELHLSEHPHLSGGIVFRQALFDRESVLRIARRWTAVLRAAVEDPARTVADLAAPGDADRAGATGPVRDLPPSGLPGLVERIARDRAADLAVCGPAGDLSYGALWEESAGLAGALLAAGVRPEAPVPVLLERGPGLSVAALAVLRAGGCYAPLDPGHPAPRLRELVAATGARIAVVGPDGASPGSLPAGVVAVGAGARAPLTAPPRADLGRAAYLMWTSGSTGRPKGVVVEHRALLNHVLSLAEEHRFGPGTVLAAIASPSFDASVAEVFGPMGVGGTTLMVPAGAPWQPRELARVLVEHRATAVSATPTAWKALLDDGGPLLPLTALVGGEPVPADLIRRLTGAMTAVHTQYGPTETAVWCTVAALTGTGPVPLGDPVRNVAVHLVDDDLRPVGVGAVGEIVVSGAAVARGYLGAPAATAERFLPDPFSEIPGARMYRTGDLARRLPGGALVFAGRRDEQLCVRGHRIEPAEVETALRAAGPVADAAVAVREDRAGDEVLVGYLVRADSAHSPDADLLGQVRLCLRERLPRYLVPDRLVLLDALPVTANGKIDRAGLPAPADRDRLLAAGYVAPRTPLETEIAEQVAEFLGLDRVGVHDDFFDLGAHSVRAAQLAVALQEHYGVELVMQKLFGSPTVARLAELVDAGLRRRRLLDRDGARAALDELDDASVDALLAGALATRNEHR